MLNSLRGRLTLIMILLAVVPLLVIGSFLTYRAFNLQQQNAEDLQLETSRRVAAEIEAYMDEQGEQLAFVRDVRGLSDLSRQERETLLTDLLLYQNSFTEVALLDAQGRETLRLSRDQIFTAADLVDQSGSDEFVIPATEREAYYGPVAFDEQTGEPFVVLSIPLIDKRADEVTGVLVAKGRFKTVWDLLASQEFAAGQDIYVLAGEPAEDGSERIVAHRNPSYVLGDTFVRPVDTTGVTTGLQGDEVVMAVERFALGTQTYTVVSEVTTDEALRSAYQNLYTVIGGLVVFTLITSAVGYVLLGQVTRPLAKLAGAAEQIGAGDLSVQVDVRGRTEIGVLARAFSAMTQRLQDLIGSLEQRVAARTRDLKIATQVSEQVATILDIDQLLPQMVELTKSSFDLYHAHAYLLDEKGENLVLAAGAGEAGQVMKQRKHSIPLDAERSLVARAARGNTPIVVDDVRNEPGFLANPLLPNTQSEAAFPLAVGDRVLGVLDVQSTEVGHFDADMQSVLTTLAGQVAVAIDNARLFSSVESASRHEQALSTITQEIGRATNMDEVLQIAARELGKALRVPYTAIELQVPSGRTTENETPVQDLEVETQ